jgi:hypothetical protein
MSVFFLNSINILCTHRHHQFSLKLTYGRLGTGVAAVLISGSKLEHPCLALEARWNRKSLCRSLSDRHFGFRPVLERLSY